MRLLLLPAFLTLLLGCSGDPTPPSPTHPGPQNTGFPLTVLAWDGELLQFDAPPERILPTVAGTADLLAALIPPDRVVALPFTAEVYATFPEDREEWLALPSFPDLSAMALLAFEPDLVVAQSWQTAGAINNLRAAGVPVLVLPLVKSLDDVRDSLETLGAVLDRQETADALQEDLDRRIAALARTAPTREHLRVLGYSNYGTGGWVPGANTTMDAIITAAGLQNAAREVGLENTREVDYERLLVLDPDLIIVEVEPDGTPGPTENLLRGEELLAGLSALQTNGLLRLPRRLNVTSSQHMVSAAEELARLADEWLKE